MLIDIAIAFPSLSHSYDGFYTSQVVFSQRQQYWVNPATQTNSRMETEQNTFPQTTGKNHTTCWLLTWTYNYLKEETACLKSKELQALPETVSSIAWKTFLQDGTLY